MCESHKIPSDARKYLELPSGLLLGYQSYQIFDYFLKKNIIIQYYIINITNIEPCEFLRHTSCCALDGNASQEIVHGIQIGILIK